MSLEQKIKGVEKEMSRCDWCGIVDERKMVNGFSGDDLENPKPFHEECLVALNHFIFLHSTETDKTTEQKIKMANQLAGIEKYKDVRK